MERGLALEMQLERLNTGKTLSKKNQPKAKKFLSHNLLLLTMKYFIIAIVIKINLFIK